MRLNILYNNTKPKLNKVGLISCVKSNDKTNAQVGCKVHKIKKSKSMTFKYNSKSHCNLKFPNVSKN